LSSANLPLAGIGMPGCTLLADPLVLELISGPGTAAVWTFNVPGTPSLFGATFFNQGFSLDPGANMLGFAASNAGRGTLGF
jgi:hypothetical protein